VGWYGWSHREGWEVAVGVAAGKIVAFGVLVPAIFAAAGLDIPVSGSFLAGRLQAVNRKADTISKLMRTNLFFITISN